MVFAGENRKESTMNVVIYARFSSHSQREQSIEGQLHDCYDYAARYGLNVVGEYIDRAISGTTDDRPDFQRMIADAAKHQFERIIVWKLDRFARNRYDSALYKHKLKQHGVRVISAMENVGEGDESILLEALLEASAEYYSMDLRKKIKRGQRENIAKGLYCGGSVAFGYKAENGKLVPDEKTAPIIRRVFDLYASGVQMKEIVKEMRSRGVKTQRGGEVTHSTFTRALTNTVYIGKYMYKGQEIPGMAAPIIDEAVFYRAAERLKSNKRATVTERTKVEYLLHGKAFCGKCGGHMIGASGTSKTGDKHYYYACIGRRKKMGCTKANEKKDFIEWYVVEQTLQYVLAPERLRYIAKAVVEEYKKEFGATQEEELVKAIKRYDREMEKLVDAIVEAPKAAHKKIYEKIESVEKQKAALESDLTKLRLASSIRFTESEVSAWLMQFCKGDLLDVEFRRKIIDVFINSIYLYDDRIIIFYNIKGGKQVTYMDVVESTEPPSDSSTVDALPPPNASTVEPKYIFVNGMFGCVIRRDSKK